MKKKDIRILLVDDEADILEILSYNLSAEGYEVFTAKNGVEGVAKAKYSFINYRFDNARNGWN